MHILGCNSGKGCTDSLCPLCNTDTGNCVGMYYITKTRPCFIQIFPKLYTLKIFIKKIGYFLYSSSKPPRRVGSNEYPQCMFWIKKKKVYPCKPQFFYIKVGQGGVNIPRTLFPDDCLRVVILVLIWFFLFYGC